MKTQLFTALGIFLVTVVLDSCKDNSTNNLSIPVSASASTASAHPALTYATVITQHQRQYTAIAVMDSDGTHATNIYTSSDPTYIASAHSPRWSSSGSSIVFLEQLSGNPVTTAIKVMDVSVNSRGVPAGSNVRTLYTSTEQINDVAWCSASGTGRIAFAAQHLSGSASDVSEVYTIAQNGGSPTAIITLSNTVFKSLTWNPDDSKLAVIKKTYSGYLNAGDTNSSHLWILNSSNGSLLEDDDLSNFNTAAACEWARSGNTIAFHTFATDGSLPILSYIDYASNAGSYTNGATGNSPTWSPNNSSLMLGSWTTGNLMKVNAFGSIETTIAPGAGGAKWKR